MQNHQAMRTTVGNFWNWFGSVRSRVQISAPRLETTRLAFWASRVVLNGTLIRGLETAGLKALNGKGASRAHPRWSCAGTGLRNRHLDTGTHAYQPHFIQLPPSVSEVLAETLQRRAEYAKSERWEKDCGLVFTTSVGTPVEYRNVVTHFKKVISETGLPNIRFQHVLTRY